MRTRGYLTIINNSRRRGMYVDALRCERSRGRINRRYNIATSVPFADIDMTQWVVVLYRNVSAEPVVTIYLVYGV